MMESENLKSSKTLLKKLKRKADLCRYSHSELCATLTLFRNCKDFIITSLSVALTLIIGFYYRRLLTEEWVIITIFVLPAIIILIQALDHTVFRWTSRAAQHEKAIQIWGEWIRKADFLEKRICQYTNEIANEKMSYIHEKYNDCMDNTPQIPNRKFLKYKLKFRKYRLKSEKIDTMTLDDTENEKRHKG